MHFVVSWEIKPKGSKQGEINTAMLQGIQGYSWLRLLSTFYILEVDARHDWNVVHEKLLAIAQRYQNEVNFLMSPLYDIDSEYFVYQMPDQDFYQDF
jgi:hypothetical protein